MKFVQSLLLCLAAAATTAQAFAPTTIIKSTVTSSLQSSVPAGDYKSPSEANENWLTGRDDVILDPDFTLTWAMAALCPTIIWYHPSFTDGPSVIGVAGGLFHLVFAALLWVQTLRVRCVFHKDGFEFYNLKGPGLTRLETKPDNYVAGTPNRWRYDQITNYDFFPTEEFPVICYFKERQTDEAKWDKWFAAFDYGHNGQPHFFPGICNTVQFKKEMEKRGVPRKTRHFY